MKKGPPSESGLFNPRVLLGLVLCSCGVLLGMFSLAATPLSDLASGAEPTARSESSPSRKPLEATRINTNLPPDPANFLSTSGNNANRLPPGVPLHPSLRAGELSEPESGLDAPPGRKPGTESSLNRQGDLSSRSGLDAGFAGMPLRPGTASGANSLGNPVFPNQQPAPLSVPQPAASESMPLASGAASDWSIVTSPNAGDAQTINYLNSVTCVSVSQCWAVGYSYNGIAYQTLIERWDGTSWAIVSSSNTSPGQTTNFLNGVTCVSASDCWAVGRYFNGSAYQTVIERWDGISWAIVTSPNTSATQSNYLNGVTCVSASECWAAGYYFNGSASQTLIERWDGTSWAILSSPNTSASQENFLYGVACMSASECWAVGYYFTGSGYDTLIERWDGTSWVIVSSPNPIGSLSTLLFGVTCVSASDCWAVGRSFNGITQQTLIEHWDGTSWTIVTSPNTLVAQTNFLAAVTCASASNCWAVGYYLDRINSAAQTLIERWDGTSWAIVTSPNTSVTQDNVFAGVTCASASNCWAVGYRFNNDGITSAFQALIERWDGTSWAIVTSPDVSLQNNVHAGVTCTSESNCWAAGYYLNGITSAYQTLIEHWDGTSWAIVSSPNTSTTQHHFLEGLTCASASNCWAVGYYFVGSAYQTLIQRWDGTSWAIVTSPNTSPGQTNVLSDVTCTSVSNCWAFGYYFAGATYQTLIERWDGTSWAIVSSPNTSITQHNFLDGVACTSTAADCWAVGYYNNGSADQTLIERWDGTSWAIVTSPNTSPGQTNVLSDVTCTSVFNCWAVGYYNNGSADQTLTEHWDGTSWAIVTSPSTSIAQHNVIEGVTCVSASNCWAIGYSGVADDSAWQTLIERWDGTSWSIVTSPNTSTMQDNYLVGVTCVSAAADCWAVGYYNVGPVARTFTMRYTASAPPTPTGVVSRKTHGTAGDFDINLPLTGNPGVECRTGGTNNDYQIRMTFPKAVTFKTAAVTSGTGTISSTTGSGTTVLTMNLTGVTNAQTITLTLSGANDRGPAGEVEVRMSVLVADVNGNGIVSNTDASLVQSQVAAPVSASNFRNDVTANGVITGTDRASTKAQVGTGLP